MKHHQTGIAKVGPINPDGHAIGVDIGATAVRAAILSPGTNEGRPSVTVHGLGSVPLPPGAVVNGVVTDQSAVTAALKALWRANKFECRNVILGITNQQVVVRDMTVPNLSPQQRAKALPFQAREIVALPMDQVLIDFAQLGEVDPEAETVSGLLVATPRQPVLAAVEAVERANLKVARVDLSSFAVLRSIAHEQLSVEAVIDLGAHLTSIVIHSHGVTKVVRTISRGGRQAHGAHGPQSDGCGVRQGRDGPARPPRRDHKEPQRIGTAAARRDPKLHPLLRLHQQRSGGGARVIDRRRIAATRPRGAPVRAARPPDQRARSDAAHP